MERALTVTGSGKNPRLNEAEARTDSAVGAGGKEGRTDTVWEGWISTCLQNLSQTVKRRPFPESSGQLLEGGHKSLIIS